MSRRVALVTGGARGIGQAICEGLAADERAVVVTDLLGDDAEATAAAIRDAGGEAMALPLDITDSAAVTAAVEAVTEAWGAPHMDAARPVAEEELAQMSALCEDQPDNTLIVLERSLGDAGVTDRFRLIPPQSAALETFAVHGD